MMSFLRRYGMVCLCGFKSTLQLFNYIAACIAEFQEQEGLKGQGRLLLGFTFSFPCNQDGLASARLVRWTKGFHCAGVEGNDVVQLLKEAINKRGVRLSITIYSVTYLYLILIG